MAGTLFKVGLSAAALLAVVFQVYLKDPVWLGFGIGRTTKPISDFPYACRSIFDSRMEACEDMWLSESTRQLFLACSNPLSRPHWMPT
jgi:arylesterase/paraoxonase